ncbi:hypothetical protein M378DRAFT_165360 [Amanita muscaria Koide BX008]|uniref:Uncharacterized protein n=1 Tax=Amanita muscaria (strain Koide BX008) TaxID=946122 RepID=A0A0C2WMA6_AMAMK|nr:hypothetical protein M378DRAFT_165360 [Amanita muscaria Koide BX008]
MLCRHLFQAQGMQPQFFAHVTDFVKSLDKSVDGRFTPLRVSVALLLTSGRTESGSRH